MAHQKEMDFFRKMLDGLHISSCIVTDPATVIPSSIDLGLRKELFGHENYIMLLVNDFVQVKQHTVYCYSDEYFCKYIFFAFPGETGPAYFYIGPYLLQMPTKQWLQNKGKQLNLDERQQEAMELYYTGLPIFEDESTLLSMCNTFAATIWGEEKGHTLEYIQYVVTDHIKPIPTNSFAVRTNESDLDLKVLEQNYHNEKILMDAVSKGQLHLLTVSSAAYNRGTQQQTNDSLRERKNQLIILKTLLRKAAEYGGVHPLHIHRLSTQFSEEIEAVRTVKQGLRLREKMIRSYCLLVRQHSLSKYSYYVGQVITLVQYDLTANLRLSSIAEKLNVNASYLSDLFHREYGCTLTEFINKQRIDHSIHLLKSTSLSVQQIAAECGFQDAPYFIRLFKRQTGLTPSHYRAQMQI